MTEAQRTGPGRPAIGEPIRVRLGDDLQAAVDQWADSHGVARAEAIRQLLTAGLAAPKDELERLFPEYVGEDPAQREYLIWEHVREVGSADLRLMLGLVEGGGSDYGINIELGAVEIRAQWILFRTVTPTGQTVGDGDITVSVHAEENIIAAYQGLLAETTAQYYDSTRGALWTPDRLDGQFGDGTNVSWEGVIDPATVEGMVEPVEEPAPWEI